MSSRRWAACVLLSAALAAPDALGQARASDQAQALFNGGAQAYAKGDYGAAIVAFEEAYRAQPRPGILFSIAQAHRKQFYVARAREHLGKALEHYRAYLEKVPDGNKRADAVQAVIELEAIAAKLEPAGDGAAGTAAPPAAIAKTRLMVSSPVEGARVELDGAEPRASPLIVEVKPGKHHIRVVAPGHFEQQRDVVAVEGGLVALDVALREEPARLSIAAADGADVVVDRRPIGRTPLSGPIELAPGRHFIAVTKSGHRPFTETVSLARGQRTSIQADLQVTGQRVAAYVLGAGAGAAVVAGAVFTGIALEREGAAKAVLAEGDVHTISQTRLDEYGDAKASRDVWKSAAAATFGAGAALGVAAFAVYVFDSPRAPAPAVRQEDPDRVTPLAPSMEVSAAPAWWPGGAGVHVQARF